MVSVHHRYATAGGRTVFYRESGDPRAQAFRADLPAAEVHLLDGGHFLLESELAPVAALMREFLARTRQPSRGVG
jgi:surfactin synthase thioesterase subunit